MNGWNPSNCVLLLSTRSHTVPTLFGLRCPSRRFFELNPLGQLGLAVLRDGIALKLTDLSGSPEAQIAQLQQYGMDTGQWGWVVPAHPRGLQRLIDTVWCGSCLHPIPI